MGYIRNECKTLVVKSEGKRTFERLKLRCKDNINTGIKEIGSEDVDWIQVAQDKDQWRAVLNTIMNLRVP
jgi:hypothetical protein